MKKSLVIISFAFIFLLTLSVVSAGLWITGDAVRGNKGCNTDSDCSAGQICVDGVCEFSQQFWYCESGSGACAGSSKCHSQLQACRDATGTKCERCRLEIAKTTTRDTTKTPASTTSRGSGALRSSRGSACPSGNRWVQTTSVSGDFCCMKKAENRGRFLGLVIAD